MPKKHWMVHCEDYMSCALSLSVTGLLRTHQMGFGARGKGSTINWRNDKKRKWRWLVIFPTFLCGLGPLDVRTEPFQSSSPRRRSRWTCQRCCCCNYFTCTVNRDAHGNRFFPWTPCGGRWAMIRNFAVWTSKTETEKGGGRGMDVWMFIRDSESKRMVQAEERRALQWLWIVMAKFYCRWGTMMKMTAFYNEVNDDDECLKQDGRWIFILVVVCSQKHQVSKGNAYFSCL